MTTLRDIVMPVVCILANAYLVRIAFKWMRAYRKLLLEHHALRLEMITLEDRLAQERLRKKWEQGLKAPPMS